MAQRLRLYFGSGRSNTAPEILEGDSEEQQEDGEEVAAVLTPTSFLSRPPRVLAGETVQSTNSALRSEPLLKRSSSMFIPQLTSFAEPRATKSSSMHISLQRSSDSSNGEPTGLDDVPPPCYTPPGPAPAYTELRTQADLPRQSPPPYYSPDCLNVQSCLVEPNFPKRRVFCLGSTFNRPQPGSSVGTICIMKKSPYSSDVQHFRILPNGGTGWSVQQENPDHCFDVNGKTQRLVFQLQQDQKDPNQGRQQLASHQEECSDFGQSSSRGLQTGRYPRIRFHRTSSQQSLLLENKRLKSGTEYQTIEENPTYVKAEAKNGSNGCGFKIGEEAPRRQPHFKIYFSSSGGGDQESNLGKESTNNPKVIK